MLPLISVIIPYYSNVDTIERALQSVLDQKTLPFEILLINDASPDWKKAEKTVSIINNLLIKVIHHSINKNGSAARNTGIKNAKGEYLAFLDADDEWLPNHLSTYVEMLTDDNKNNLFYCQSIVKSGGFNDLLMPENGLEKHSLSEYLFCEKGFIPTPSLFISRELALNNLFNEDLIRHQDYDFLFRLNEKKIDFVFSDHTGVVVHWENNDIEDKGGTADYSLNWATNHKKWFSSKAFSYFILKHVVYSLWKNRQIKIGLSILLKNVNILKLSMKEWYFAASMLFYGKIIIPWKK
jgi:amylovoran biosynthesis glycosyltransferase AmsB